MAFLQKHSEEIYWLNRRIYFLELLDEALAHEHPKEAAVAIADQFKKVENLTDLIARFKEIYGEELL